MVVLLSQQLKDEYTRLFDTCVVRPEREKEAATLASSLLSHQDRYEAAGRALGIPWHFIAIVHHMECGQRFDRHLHNGDPLTGKTVRVPAGRPLTGIPPFSWEQSAEDALRMSKLDQVEFWDLPCTLYQFERYNGFGYRTKHPDVLSPYLWSGSGHYQKGKFVADGKFDPSATSKQIGAAVLLQKILAKVTSRPPAT